MPYVQHGELLLPFTGKSPRSRSASLSGARVAVTRAGSQVARLLIAYLQYGASTDMQMAERLGLPESRISARRSTLIAQHKVEYVDDVIGKSGAKNCRWQLTSYGSEVARELDRCL